MGLVGGPLLMGGLGLAAPPHKSCPGNGSTNAYDKFESFVWKLAEQVTFVRKLAQVTFASAAWHTWKLKHECKLQVFPPIASLTLIAYAVSGGK